MDNEKREKLEKFIDIIFPKGDDLRARIFNILALCGVIICVVTAFINLLVEASFFGFFACFVGMFISLALLLYTRKTGKYKPAMILTILIIFIGLFTFLFFSGGGYHSGMPTFFIFAIVFTAFMLDGISMPIFVLLELVWYSGLMCVAYANPEMVSALEDEISVLLDVWFSGMVVAISLALTMYLQIRIYRKKQNELNEAIRAADEANRAKSDFLAKMSHDIRTPINTILAMNEMIADNTSSARIREWVNDSNVSGRILLSLIDDMLDLTRIEAGKIELIERPLDISRLFKETQRLWKPQADRKGLDFIYEHAPEVPAFLKGDEDVIRKITNNLLSNAVKYTRAGSVILNVDWDGELKLTITDTGVGIAPEYLANIFKPFERGVQDVYRETSGSGLGLAIVKELVDVLGGSIDCKSEVNVGTAFYVKLPLKEHIDETEKRELTKEESTDEKQTLKRFVAPEAKILVVDDTPFNLKIIENFLEPTLIHVDSVESGFEALEMIDIKEYDLIFMDLRMPKMDGAETLDKMKEEYPDLKTPVILLTADIMNGIEDKMLARGFSDFLSKPINSTLLFETIRKYIPDKIMSIEMEEESGLSVSRIESYQEMLMPYGINIKTAIDNNGGDVDEFLNRTALFEDYADDGIRYLRKTTYDDDYYIRVHSAKSVARGIGAYLLAELAETIELRRDNDFSVKANGMLIDEFKRVREGIVKLRVEEELKHG
ncbi:MAG: response regulator [Lachnospiraceae bacterium]|nr:response regulator [Lachnospiraceae bacterium]